MSQQPATIMSVIVPTADLPCRALDTDYLVNHGHVCVGDPNDMRSIAGFVKSVASAKTQSGEHALAVHFHLALTKVGVALLEVVSAGTGLFDACFEGEVRNGKGTPRNIILRPIKAAPGRVGCPVKKIS